MRQSALPTVMAGRVRSTSTGLLLALCVALVAPNAAQAQALQHYAEDGGLVRGRTTPGAMGADLFGEQWSPYSGTVQFVQQDFSVPGNSKLPVGVARRMMTGVLSGYSLADTPRGFGDWELDIPYMKVNTALAEGWQLGLVPNTGTSNNRCSGFGDDLTPTHSLDGTTVQPGLPLVTLRVPGGGDEDLLLPSGAYPTPTDGRTYVALTKSGWQLTCKTLAGPSGALGEGFIAVAPDGTQYRFDWMVTRRIANGLLQRQSGGTAALGLSAAPRTPGASRAPVAPPPSPDAVVATREVQRAEVRLLPTQVIDRHGNTVTYQWNPANPWQLQSITANDGRSITFGYNGNLIASATDGTRTWTYDYEGPSGESNNIAANRLKTVHLPDGSTWSYSGASLQYTRLLLNDCASTTAPATTYTKTMTHPSGAQGSFTLKVRKGPFTIGNCYNDLGFYTTRQPFGGLVLSTKVLSGPGLPAATWTYGDYVAASDRASFVVTDPRSVQTRYTFGITYQGNEGQLLQKDDGWNGSTAVRTTTYRYRSETAGPYGARFGYSLNTSGDGQSMVYNRPQDKVTIAQQGAIFSAETTGYDTLARPTTVVRTGTGGSRTETTSYADNKAIWVMGQVDQVTASTGQVMVDNDYHPSTALLTATRKFGILQRNYTYNTDGTLYSEADGKNNTTYYTNYKRGLPQTVSYPNGASETAIVNDIGLVSSVTSAASYTTGYGYDAVGRLASITPPAGFTGTTIGFVQVPTAEYGLPAGHWRHTVTQGNAITATYFDALWRPVMTRTYDAATEATTRKVLLKQFDIDGRTTYEAYPVRDAASYTATPGGVTTSYEELGREKQKLADSELGTLTTTTDYLTGFQTRVTNPRLKATTQTLWALDDPGKAMISTIAAPAGVNVSIARDSFGKPTSITRSGTFNGYTSNVTRRYVYDAGQRLCKTIEPEVGATVQDYDGASNIAWKAPGQNLPSTTSCDLASVPAAAKLVYGYTPLNLLGSVTYGDSSPSIGRTYTPDGLLETISSAGSTWTYGYNALRQLATESLAYSGQTYGLSWGFNSAGKLSTLTYPDGSSVSYSPNALGEATAVGSYATGITYHPNGAVAAYSLGNGIAHSLTLNTRGLPLVNSDGTVVQDQYGYDANGNVTAITDLRTSPPDGSSSRTMGYDDLDRLASASAPGTWGSATYAYDPVDNLRSAVVGTRSSTLNFDANNQLSSVVTNGSSTSYGFDALGNLRTKGGQTFTFDIGNRLSASSLGGGYTYDGHGRRFRIASTDGSTRIQVYSQAGQILWATSAGGPRPTSTTAYIYLGTKQIAEKTAGVVQYAHTDALGSPVAHTNPSAGVLNRSRFEPYGYVAAGTKPSANTSTIGFTGHVQDAETDLVYMQQRYYDPLAGRFLSIDPIVTDANTGKGFGLYAYVDNNPYSRVDPDGRNWVLAGIGAGALLCARNPTCAAIAIGVASKVISKALQNASKPEEPKAGSEQTDNDDGKASDDAVSGLVGGLAPEKGGKKGHFVKPGGDAEEDLDALPGEVGKNGQKTLPDGSVAGTHVSHTTNEVTLHIHRPVGKRDVKIRYPEPEKKKEPPEEKQTK